MLRRSRAADARRAAATRAVATALGSFSVALLLPSGCKCGEDRPYTPFRIDEPHAAPTNSAPTPSASASAGAALPAGSAFPREAAVVPGDSSRFAVDGVPVEVAPERVIDRALAADFDGDGSKDAVAWTRARTETADTTVTGELVFFGGKTPAGRVVGGIPPFVPSGPACKHTVTLAQTGPHTVTLDVAAHCEAALVARSPTRGVSVIAPAAERPTLVALRFADPAPSESLAVAIDSRDADADGRDDVRVTVTLTSDPEDDAAAADLLWFDRAAGPSRDRAEPAHSLAAQGTPAFDGDKSIRRAAMGRVPGRIGNARRLASTLCAENGTPRVFDSEGAPLACSDLDAAMQALLGAEVGAHVWSRDPLAAAVALGRDGWYAPPLPPKTRASLEKEVVGASVRRDTTEQPLEVTPRARSGLPRFSPLAFEPDGALLVETADGVSRVRLPDARVEDASESVDPWPLTAAVNEPRWTGIAFPCDRSEVMLLETDPAGTPLPSVRTRLVAPRPGPCRHGGLVPAPDLVPVEWARGRYAGLIGGGLFGVASVAELAPVPPRGAPRSPDGKSLVIPWSQGLLVTTGTKTSAWSVTTTPLTDCVVANDATAVACVHGDHAVLLTPSAPSKTKRHEK